MFVAKDGSLDTGPQCAEEEFLCLLDDVLAGKIEAQSFPAFFLEYYQRSILRRLAPSVPPPGFSFWMSDPDHRIARLVATAGFTHTIQGYPTTARYDEGIVGKILANMSRALPASPIVVPDYAEIPEYLPMVPLLRSMGFIGGAAFPVCVGGTLLGVAKLYSTMPFSAEAANRHAFWQLESKRLSAYLTTVRAYLSNRLQDVYLAPLEDLHPRIQSLREPDFRQAIEAYLRLLCELLSAHRVEVRGEGAVFSVELTATRIATDVIRMPLRVLHPARESTFACEVSGHADATYFSAFERELAKAALVALQPYLSAYLVSQDLSSSLSQRDAQLRLLESTKDTSLALLSASSVGGAIDTLLRTVHDNFDFSAVVFLRYADGALAAEASLPAEIAGSVRGKGITLPVQSECKHDAGCEWSPGQCAACGECKGLTAIAALRKSVLSIHDLTDKDIARLFVDFGVSARSEFVLPLVVRKQVYGVLDLYRESVSNLTDYEVYFLDAITNTAALALYNTVVLDIVAGLHREETRGSMARDVVHTLTPTISSLKNYGVLIQDELTAIRQHPADRVKVREEAGEALGMLGELVDVIREQGNLLEQYGMTVRGGTEQEDDISIYQVIEDVLRLNAIRADLKRVKFKHAIEGKERTLHVQQRAFYYVLWNLVNNAVKFTRGNKPTVVRVAEVYEEKGIRIAIRDEGVGIRDYLRRRIWELGFSTVAPGEEKETSGLGLFTVSELVGRMEGADVECRWSKVNQGSEFVLHFSGH